MRYLFRFSIFTAFILLLSGSLIVISHYFLEHNAAPALSQAIAHCRILITVIRYIIYALILIYWPFFIRKVGVNRQWPTTIIEQWSHQRIKLLGLFAMIEVLFVYNVLGHIFIWL